MNSYNTSIYIEGQNVDEYSPKDNIRLILKGHVFILDKCIKSAYELYKTLAHYKNIGSIVNQISGGSFLIIFQNPENEIIIITDVIRSYPAFVYKNKNCLILTTDLALIPDLSIDTDSLDFGITPINVLSNKNLFQNVFSCQAADFVTIKRGNITSTRYFAFLPDNSLLNRLSRQQFIASFNRNMEQTMEKMFRSSDSVRSWIIPLSGGHDSRILVNSLIKAKIENVICFSYGTPNNLQSKISEQIATKAGFDWHFIEYTEDKWGDLHESGLFDNYIDFAFQGVSIPHLQDFLAVYELLKKNIIKTGDIVVPGHALDFIAGSHLNEDDFHLRTNLETIERVSLKFEYSFKNKTILHSILNEFQGEFSQFQEFINWQERQTKFICNSCRVYEFFGLEFRLPFWDIDFLKYWLSIPKLDRLNRNLFLDSERDGILREELCEISFDNEIKDQKFNFSFYSFFKRMLPESVKLLLLRITRRKSILSEGMNLIFTHKGKYVEDFIGPLTEFPNSVGNDLKPIFTRRPYQVNPHVLSGLYAIKRAIDK